ncbi:hypothetical protein [Trinickia soli]|uniref:Phage tail protein n=1 Tax=Trinickia soli TaxID=380675 RepID=A0A2N7VQ03_9BURK|nr:hypothetical protein [Trinickia soli]PMS19244.1 hypothetical protein C0Z19_21680 [Trinickia soli]CAB3643914.1 hypothetical protein LMG24076_00438 [Trinickia soli]
MKRLLTAALLALSSAVFAATTVPVQLLNPAASTSGQVISSTGPSTAPAWTTLTAAGLGGLTASNNLSDLVSAATARTNLGLTSAATTSIGTSGATIPLLSTANTWTLGQTFSVRPTFNGATPWDSANLASPASTTGNLSQFAATTSAQLAGVLSDETGSGAAVFANSPTINTPSIVGPTNGSGAAAGNVGEVICAQVTSGGSPTGCATNSSTPVSLTSGITNNVTSITLTPGNWRVWGQAITIPAGTTTQSVVNAAISPTSTSFTGQVAELLLPFSAPAGSAVGGTLDPMPIRVTTNTTYYLIVNSTFAVSTNTAIGFIAAQRTN